jgi:predicted nucleic acid-binding protein
MTFIDTNVLVYAAADEAPLLDRARAALARPASVGPLAINRQVWREYLSVITRQQIWGKPLALAEAVADTAEFIRQFTVLEDGPLVWDRLVMLGHRYSFAGRQVHDANIVATMLAHGEHRILTFNGVDFRRFTRLIEWRHREPGSGRSDYSEFRSYLRLSGTTFPISRLPPNAIWLLQICGLPPRLTSFLLPTAWALANTRNPIRRRSRRTSWLFVLQP